MPTIVTDEAGASIASVLGALPSYAFVDTDQTIRFGFECDSEGPAKLLVLHIQDAGGEAELITRH